MGLFGNFYFDINELEKTLFIGINIPFLNLNWSEYLKIIWYKHHWDGWAIAAADRKRCAALGSPISGSDPIYRPEIGTCAARDFGYFASNGN